MDEHVSVELHYKDLNGLANSLDKIILTHCFYITISDWHGSCFILEAHKKRFLRAVAKFDICNQTSKPEDANKKNNNLIIRSRSSGFNNNNNIQHSLATEVKTDFATTTITRKPRFPRGVFFVRRIRTPGKLPVARLNEIST